MKNPLASAQLSSTLNMSVPFTPIGAYYTKQDVRPWITGIDEVDLPTKLRLFFQSQSHRRAVREATYRFDGCNGNGNLLEDAGDIQVVLIDPYLL